MAKGVQPVYPQYAAYDVGKTLTAANTNRDGTGAGKVLLLTGAAEETIVPVIIVQAVGACSQSVVRLFLNNGADPEVATNNQPVGEIPIDDYTPANDTEAPYEEFYPPCLVLKANHRLYATLSVVGNVAAQARGGTY